MVDRIVLDRWCYYALHATTLSPFDGVSAEEMSRVRLTVRSNDGARFPHNNVSDFSKKSVIKWLEKKKLNGHMDFLNFTTAKSVVVLPTNFFKYSYHPH